MPGKLSLPVLLLPVALAEDARTLQRRAHA